MDLDEFLLARIAEDEAVAKAAFTGRIRAYHPATGSVLYAEVTDETGETPHRSFRVIPDGLAEEVILREGVWQITDLGKP